FGVARAAWASWPWLSSTHSTSRSYSRIHSVCVVSVMGVSLSGALGAGSQRMPARHQHPPVVVHDLVWMIHQLRDGDLRAFGCDVALVLAAEVNPHLAVLTLSHPVLPLVRRARPAGFGTYSASSPSVCVSGAASLSLSA